MTQQSTQPEADLEGRVAVIVGGAWREPGGSIGGAAAVALARRGATIVVIDRDPALADITVAMIAGEGGQAHAIIGDASNHDRSGEMITQVALRHGRIDVLVNNIGASSAAGIENLDPDRWRAVMAANLESALFATKHAGAYMSSGGAIVNLSSIASDRPGKGGVDYTVSKAAIEGLTRATAYQYGPAGIRANCVQPGETVTWRVLEGRDNEQQQEVRSRFAKRTVLGWAGGCWEIADTIVFLASDQSRWITGQTIRVDGGAGLKRAELS